MRSYLFLVFLIPWTAFAQSFPAPAPGPADDMARTDSAAVEVRSAPSEFEKASSILREFAHEACSTLDGNKMNSEQVDEMAECMISGKNEREVPKKDFGNCSYFVDRGVTCARAKGFTCVGNFFEAALYLSPKNLVVIDRPGKYRFEKPNHKRILIKPGIDPELAIEGDSRAFFLAGPGINGLRVLVSRKEVLQRREEYHDSLRWFDRYPSKWLSDNRRLRPEYLSATNHPPSASHSSADFYEHLCTKSNLEHHSSRCKAAVERYICDKRLSPQRREN